MKTIIVDYSRFHLMQLAFQLAEFTQVEVCGTFTSPFDAFSYARQHIVDMAFIKIDMPEISGQKLVEMLREIYPGIIIVLVSDNRADISSAISLRADCFIPRPYSPTAVGDAVHRAEAVVSRLSKRVFIKTFGSFGVFVDDAPLHFSSAKAQELLAYLVDRNGNVVDTREGFSVLWEDRSFCTSSSSCYRKVLSRLLSTLEEAGISNILRIYTRGRAINKSVVNCDYYSYLAGNRQVIKGWNGEYMTNYSWAEPTLGWLHENRKRYYSSM